MSISLFLCYNIEYTNSFTERRENMKIISFTNFKGGVAKTTSTVSIGGELAQRGYKILIIDLDPQGNASSALGRKGLTKEEDMTSEFLVNEIVSPDDFIVDTDIANLFIVPTCSFNLSVTMNMIDANKSRRPDIRLKIALKNLESHFDFILLDCSPADNILNSNALVASDFVIIPVKLDKYSLEGFDILQTKIHYTKEETNEKLKILGIIETMYRPTTLYKTLHDELKKNKDLSTLLFKTKIRNNIKAEESPFQEVPLNIYDKNSNAAIDYRNLTDEILDRINSFEKEV